MIYSRADKVEQYLSHYNITGVEAQKGSWNTRLYLTNIHTNKPYKLEIQNPLYNILSGEDNHHEFDPKSLNGHNYLLRNMIFDYTDVGMTEFIANFLNTEYYKRYGTLEHEAGKKQSSEYFSFLEMKDIELIKGLAGFKDNVITGVYGNFFTMDDDTLRFTFKPTTPIVENINKVHFAQSFIFTKDGWQYPTYYIIYTKKGSTDVQFEQTNLLVNSITNNGSVVVNLSQLFGDKWTDISSDMDTLSGFGTEWFIVPSLFTCAIMRNTPTGILRYIPINFTKQFFNITFNNMDIEAKAIRDGDSGEQINTEPNFNDSNAVLEVIDNTSSEQTESKKASFVYKDDRIVPWSSMEHVEFLDQLLKLSSTAEYFNDVLFSLEDSEFQFPIYLITPIDNEVSHGPYGTQFNDDYIDNVGVVSVGGGE